MPEIEDGSTGLPLGIAVSVSFSRQIDSATLNTSNFFLSGPGGLVTGVVTYNADTLTATFVPAALLGPETLYTALITTAVKDVNAYALEADQAWSFTTGTKPGDFGVEPTSWSESEFLSLPTAFDVKRGKPGAGESTAVSAPYVTREYQICLTCHSNYTFDTPPDLGGGVVGAVPGISVTYQYTNQGMEFQSPDDHQGEYSGTNNLPSSKPPTKSGAFAGTDPAGNIVDYQTGNHRAWHPVLKNTGRDAGARTISRPDVMFVPPFNTASGLGTQTMLCTDCHGSDSSLTVGVPASGSDLNMPLTQHNEDNNFLLRQPWTDNTGENEPGGLCFRCHNFDQYANAATFNPADSGFKRKDAVSGCIIVPQNLHIGHAQVVINFRCSFCHAAVPHGWKNKNFLVNLNDVGAEVGLPPGTQVRTPDPRRYYMGPYYNGAVLKVKNFQRSGQWMPENCGSAGPPGNGLTGVGWMNGVGGETCNNIP